MSDADALLRAILDHPDDDAPRLVYADWLEDHGQPARAAFIRTEVDVYARPEWDAERVRYERAARDNPYQGAGILNFVFGEMWLRPGLGMRERRLVTVTCVAWQDAPYPILSHVYAALKSGDVSFDEMDELALHFAAYYGWAKAVNLSQVIEEQKVRVTAEWAHEADAAS